jgi:hypothetical protein
MTTQCERNAHSARVFARSGPRRKTGRRRKVKRAYAGWAAVRTTGRSMIGRLMAADTKPRMIDSHQMAS